MSGKRDQLVEVLMEWVKESSSFLATRLRGSEGIIINCDALHPDADGDEDTRTLEDLIREAHDEATGGRSVSVGPYDTAHYRGEIQYLENKVRTLESELDTYEALQDLMMKIRKDKIVEEDV